MKIAFICTEKLPSPAVKGGAIQMMLDGIIPFLKDNHEVVIFSITDPTIPNFETLNEVTYFRFPRIGFRLHVAEELKKHDFDLIHVCNRPKNIALYKEASPNSSFVLSIHNEMFTEKKLTDIEGREAIELVSAITTVSQYVKDTIVRRFPEAEEKVHVVYSGVDLKKYPPVWTEEGMRLRRQTRRKYGIPRKAKVILFIGRLSPSKGPHLLVRAMKQVVEIYDDAVLVIVGGKWFSDNRKNRFVRYLHEIATPFSENIIFTNFIPADEIQNMFLIGDLFVCSSQWNEPLARVHYEALAAGVPIITTDRGGNAEVIIDEENGLLIRDYKNPNEFARIINEMLALPNFGSWLAHNGRRLVEEKFDFMHVASRFETIYKAIETESKVNINI